MKIKTLLITAALAVVTAFTTNAQEAKEASASWAMGSADLSTVTAVSNPDGLFTATVSAVTNFTHEDSKTTGLGTRKAKPSESLIIPLTTVKNLPLSKNENVYIQFSLIPTNNFKLTNITLDAWGVKASNVRFDIVSEQNGSVVEIIKGQAPARTQEDYSHASESKDGYTFSFNVNDFAASTDEIIVKIYPYASDTSTGRELGFANVVLSGIYYEGDAPIKPEIPEGAVIAPLAFGTMYDLTKAEHNNIATVGPKDIGNTFKGTSVDFPFYLENDATIFFYLEQGAKERSNGYLLISLDGTPVGEHAVEITGAWGNYNAVSVFRLENLSAGKHVVTVARDDERCTESYAGNWRVSLHAEDVYDFANINLEAGTYVNGIRTENNGANVGYITNGSSAEYRIYIPQSGKYGMNIGLNNYNVGICKVTIKEEGVETSFDTTPVSRAYSDTRQIALGDINTPGIKTLKMEFTADHTDFIANYDNLGLERTGDVSGIADIEAAEVVSVEYYNLQGVRVEGGARGTLIRVSTDANGSRKAEKVIVR